jgi:hypothetical protein
VHTPGLEYYYPEGNRTSRETWESEPLWQRSLIMEGKATNRLDSERYGISLSSRTPTIAHFRAPFQVRSPTRTRCCNVIVHSRHGLKTDTFNCPISERWHEINFELGTLSSPDRSLSSTSTSQQTNVRVGTTRGTSGCGTRGIRPTRLATATVWGLAQSAGRPAFVPSLSST